MDRKKINSALISVFHKEGLDRIIAKLNHHGVVFYSTGGTQKYLEDLGVQVQAVEDLTSYPSILSGRVKTLHPKIFGGILARREDHHLSQLETYEIPEIDLVVVDLYPFEDTLRATTDQEEIIEKIDIGGISLIRAAAKNFKDVVVIASQAEYTSLEHLLDEKQGFTDLEDRFALARKAFKISSHYDTTIFKFFNAHEEEMAFKQSIHEYQTLRYGENPHQKGYFFGNLEEVFQIHGGKELSYNNLVDVDAAMGLIREFWVGDPAVAILKHNNPCGVAVRSHLVSAWAAALACDPVSAFGGVIVSNTGINLETAQQIDQLFYEVLIAPAFDPEAMELLLKKKKRQLLRIKKLPERTSMFKNLLNGVIVQDQDDRTEGPGDFQQVTNLAATAEEAVDFAFAIKCVKHLKSNTIVLAKNQQMIGMGCGQTSRVDALRQAISKAGEFGFDLQGAVMASDAFFPFPDCVEIAHQAGIRAVVQPGGSIKDRESIDFCNSHQMAMVITGVRHFKH